VLTGGVSDSDWVMESQGNVDTDNRDFVYVTSGDRYYSFFR
jgi:hypothetical protein